MQNKSRPIVFMGSGVFALKVLEFLYASDSIEIDVVVTQPARCVGRKKVLQATPVGQFALDNNLKVFEASNSKEIIDSSLLVGASLVVCVDYGVLLKQEVLDLPKFGIINIHPSLLPKYRGCSPLQSTLRNGDLETGVAIQKMVLAMDEGPIYAMPKYKLQQNEDIVSLTSNLALLACDYLLDVIQVIFDQSKEPVIQSGEVSYCGKIKKQDGFLDPIKNSLNEFLNYYKAFWVWPGISILFDDGRLKLLSIQSSSYSDIEPGLIVVREKRVLLGVKDGAVELLKVQPESKKPMDALAFYNGYLRD